MKRSFRATTAILGGAALLALLTPACQPTGGDTTSTGSGGSSKGSGGSSSGSGGSSNSGGSKGSGGSTSSSGSGGSSSSTGGTKGTGGTTSSGNGGTTSSGNGGTTSSGAGGTTASGAGGTTTASSSPTGTTVTFASGKAVGAMLGYGWVALGSSDTITDPTCGGTAITQAAPCTTSTTWNSTSALCITGSVPALPASPTASDYSSNWGVSVGVNATDPAGTGLGQSFSTVTIAVTGTPSSGLRAVVHRKGDADSLSYCLAYSSSAMALTKFVTDCYDTSPTGTYLTAADVTNIDKISIQVSSSSSGAITVSNLCITGITFAK